MENEYVAGLVVEEVLALVVGMVRLQVQVAQAALAREPEECSVDSSEEERGRPVVAVQPLAVVQLDRAGLAAESDRESAVCLEGSSEVVEERAQLAAAEWLLLAKVLAGLQWASVLLLLVSLLLSWL